MAPKHNFEYSKGLQVQCQYDTTVGSQRVMSWWHHSWSPIAMLLILKFVLKQVYLAQTKIYQKILKSMICKQQTGLILSSN